MRIGQNIIDLLRKKLSLVCVPYLSKKRTLSKPYTAPKSTYKQIITTQGFGCSGSGVLIDLFSECDNTTVFGGYDIKGGSPLALDKNVPKIELDLLRCWGGVFWLENFFKIPSNAYSHVAIETFISFYEHLFSEIKFDIYNDKFLELSREFVNRISNRIELPNPLAGADYLKALYRKRLEYANLENPFLYNNLNQPKFQYELKNITHEEFIEHARRYLHDFLNTIESKDFLFLDFIFGDGLADFDHYKQYIDDYKMVAIYRDPRDVFMDGLDELFIPHRKEDFVRWYKSKNIDKYINADHPNILTIRFEDLILDYEQTTTKVFNFYGIDKSHHIAPKTQFRPEYSIRNVGMYKKHKNQEDIEYIEKELKDYCYYMND